MGHKRICAVDVDEAKLVAAREQGATETVLAGGDTAQPIIKGCEEGIHQFLRTIPRRGWELAQPPQGQNHQEAEQLKPAFKRILYRKIGVKTGMARYCHDIAKKGEDSLTAFLAFCEYSEHELSLWRLCFGQDLGIHNHEWDEAQRMCVIHPDEME
jgi:hypothetical protein